MATYLKNNFEGSKVNLIPRKKSKNELSKDAKVKSTKFNFHVSESAKKMELSSATKFSEFWTEFSALMAELDALASEIKALDD